MHVMIPMMSKILLQTPCALCEDNAPFDILYKANFDQNSFSREVFSARRLPDRCHYQIVRCRHCGLVRSNPVINPEILEKLYRESIFDYDTEVGNLKKTYGFYLDWATATIRSKKGLLEIGCGNGFVLDWALDHGWSDVTGIEPSMDAIAKASDRVREQIVPRMFRPGVFSENQFRVVTLFQVLDHLPDPNQTIEEIHRILKPNGVVLAINHNVRALGARLLKSRCPIIDIEHTYLYDKETMRKLFEKHGFKVETVFSVRNWYGLGYWAQLMPLPQPIKHALLRFLRVTRLGHLRLRLGVGNLGLIARKA